MYWVLWASFTFSSAITIPVPTTYPLAVYTSEKACHADAELYKHRYAQELGVLFPGVPGKVELACLAAARL